MNLQQRYHELLEQETLLTDRERKELEILKEWRLGLITEDSAGRRIKLIGVVV